MGSQSGSGRAGERGDLVGSFRRRHIMQDVAIPISLERILLEAAADEAFRQELLADREGALAALGIELRPSEQAMLSTLPDAALLAMILRINPQRSKNAAFARTVASAVAGTMMMFTATGCFCGGIDSNPDSSADASADSGDASSDDADSTD